MSFASSAKDELTKLRARGEKERLLILAGMTSTAGSLTLGMGGRIGIQYVTENHSVGKYIAQLATGLYDLEATVEVREHDRLNARNTVVQLSGNGTKQLLLDAGALEETEDGIGIGEGVPDAALNTEEDKRMFLRGAFLGAGSVSDPNRGYHLEIVCRSEIFARKLLELIQSFGLNAKSVLRKGSSVVYLKEGEGISEFLTLVGASGSTLEFENTRVVKNVRNYINRTSNCETANMQKTAEAAVHQAQSILYIKENKGLEHLPLPLQEAAELRLNHPEATLSELAAISGMGRSAVNYRLTKLMQIAHDLQVEKGEL
ncbi:MAG: DNA-binding protein WhiA [Clostridia bacterium]|nr:DNA-binding protein WhiA [Clostridia bacterium]MBQ3201870.1 DNA-binding protein WhiA [Clostridia bacterium]